MPRTLVIQLGRLGDVIQTTPLLRELAAGGDVVDVLVLRSTHVALIGFSAVANIVTIPDSLAPLDDAIACGFPQGRIPTEAHELLVDLQLPTYDRVIHASHAPLGCWLAAASPCTNASGRFGGVILDRECLYLGAASVYRVALLKFREQNLFNLVDLTRAIPGVAPHNVPPRLYVNQSAGLPFALPAGRLVALNPGASEAKRCWAAENFARLAEAISVAGFTPVLVGAPSDRELCEQIAGAARVAIPNCAGRTTIPEMTALLARCELVVSADTGAAHLAAAVGTTVLGLYGATAWFAETAPYGNDNLTLQTPLNAPMSAISLDSAVAAAMNRLGRLSDTDLRNELRREKQLAWETSIEPSGPNDPLGGMTYTPVHRAALPDVDVPDEVFGRYLREAFATEFLTSAAIAGVNQMERTQGEGAGSRSACDSFVQILDSMKTVAHLCAGSIRKGIASEESREAATALVTATDRVRELASDPAWKPLSPVIHNLDWQLRMLPQQVPAATLRAHSKAYASAARILRNTDEAYRNGMGQEQNGETSNEYCDLREATRKEEKRGDRCLVR